MTERAAPSPVLHAVAFALMGAFSLAAQTAIFREYLVVYEGNELGVGFFYASWLAWVGIGATAALLLAARRSGIGRSFEVLLALYPLALLLQLILIRSLRSLAGVAPTDVFPTGSLFLLTALTNAPVSLLTGLLFPVAAVVAKGAARDAGGAVSRVYVLECLGAFAGGAGITAFLLLGKGALPALPFASAAVAGTGLALSLRRGSRIGAAVGSVVLTGSALLCVPPVGALLEGALDRMQWRDLHPAAKLEARAESPYRRLSVATVGRQTVALANGKIVASFPGGEESLATAALLAPQPERLERAMLIGTGLEPLAITLLRYPLQELVLLEPDPAGRDFLLEHLPGGVRKSLADPRVRVVEGDPREAISRAGGPFDLVVIDVGDPDTALAARVFTREFYEEARGVLVEGGVLATAVTSAENYHGTELRRYGASVLATLETAFAEVVVTPGERAWFVAGTAPGRVSADPSVLEARLRAIPVEERRFEPERVHQLLEPRRVEFVGEVYANVPPEERPDLVSTDARPVTFLLNLLVLGRTEGSRFSRTVLAIREAGIWILLLPIAVILLVRFRYALARPESAASGRFAGAYLLVVFGAASLSLSLVLLLSYQARFGLLFLKVGLANALFMLGLVTGGVAGGALARRFPSGRTRAAAIAGVVAAVWAGALPSAAEGCAGESAFLLLFLATGVVSGVALPLAASILSRAGASAGGAGALLETADHLGGAAGAAVAGVLLVPLFGTVTTARVTGVLLLTAPVLLALEGAAASSLAARLPSRRLRRLRSGLTTFPYLKTSFVLLGIAGAVIALAVPVRRKLDRPIVRLSEERLRAVVKADRYVEVESPWLHYDAWQEGDDAPLCHSLSTMVVAGDVTGWAGPVNLLLAMDRNGTIRQVSLIESKETPTYVRELPAFLARFAGKPADLSFVISGQTQNDETRELVKMTGATVTSRAVVETVNKAKNRVLADLLGREPPAPPARGFTLPPPATIATAILFLLAVPVFLRGATRARTGFLVTVLVVLGVVYNQQLSAGRVVEIAGLSLPPPGNLDLFVLVAGVLVLALAFGQVYCGLLCPFGAAQELMGKLRLLRRLSPEVDRRARILKHLVLVTAIVGVLLVGADRVLAFDPLEVVFSFKADALMWVLVGAILALSAFYFRFWCRYLCPVGAFLSLANRIALLLPFVRPKDYRHCDLGVRSRTDLDCLHCYRCVARAREDEP
jgi:spermidine synthase